MSCEKNRQRAGDDRQKQHKNYVDKIRLPPAVIAGDQPGETFVRVFRANEKIVAVAAFVLMHDDLIGAFNRQQKGDCRFQTVTRRFFIHAPKPERNFHRQNPDRRALKLSLALPDG